MNASVYTPAGSVKGSNLKIAEYASLDAVALSDLIANRQVSASEVQQSARDAILSVNEHLNALSAPLFDVPLDYAAEGRFRGVPFAIKEAGPVAAAIPFCCGARFFQGAAPDRDSFIMERFRAAGLAALGSTTVPEMGVNFTTESLLHGATRNPWDLDRTTGGSSGGAAALVASGALPIAHANDGAGSIRIPSAYCGLVGLKPSRYRTPVGPFHWDYMLGLAYEFGIARTVRDVAALLDAVHGYAPGERGAAPPPGQPYSKIIDRPPSGLKIGLATEAWSGTAVDPEVVRAAEAAALLLEDAGHSVERVSPSIDADALLRFYAVGLVAMVGQSLEQVGREPSDGELAAVSRQILREAASQRSVDFAASFHDGNAVARATGQFFSSYDLLVTPTTAVPPFELGRLKYDDTSHTAESWMRSIFEVGPFTAPFNVSGEPAISLPLGQSLTGLPIGVQFVAGYGREDLLLQVAAFFETAAPWRDRRPKISAA